MKIQKTKVNDNNSNSNNESNREKSIQCQLYNSETFIVFSKSVDCTIFLCIHFIPSVYFFLLKNKYKSKVTQKLDGRRENKEIKMI